MSGYTLRLESNIDEVIRVWATLGPRLDKVVVNNLNEGLHRAQYRATNQYMEKGLISRRADPPNAPPGPLKKRSFNLAKAVFIKPAEVSGEGGNTVVHQGALAVNSDQAPYGDIHEKGGRIKRRLGVRQGGRQLSVRLGKRGGRKRLRATTDIAARPFMAPSMQDEFGDTGYTTQRMGRAIDDLVTYFGK